MFTVLFLFYVLIGLIILIGLTAIPISFVLLIAFLRDIYREKVKGYQYRDEFAMDWIVSRERVIISSEKSDGISKEQRKKNKQERFAYYLKTGDIYLTK